jgi:hypothetical protein
MEIGISKEEIEVAMRVSPADTGAIRNSNV